MLSNVITLESMVLANNTTFRMAKRRTDYEIAQMLKTQKYEKKMLDAQIRLKNKRFNKKPKKSQTQAGNNQEVIVDAVKLEISGPKIDQTFGPKDVKKIDKQVLRVSEDLIFTENEIDPEKILVLHLIAVQKYADKNKLDITQTTSSPVTPKRRQRELIRKRSGKMRLSIAESVTESNDISEKYRGKRSPAMSTVYCPSCETISDDGIYSSRHNSLIRIASQRRMTHKYEWEKWLNCMPVYILETKEDVLAKKCLSFNEIEHEILARIIGLDERKIPKPQKLLTNMKIIKLINVVMEVLERIHPIKFQRIHKLAKNPELIQEVLLKDSTIRFIELLHSKGLIMHSDSFKVVTSKKPFKSFEAEICPILEKIVIAIRENNAPAQKPSKPALKFSSLSGLMIPCKTNMTQSAGALTLNRLSSNISESPDTIDILNYCKERESLLENSSKKKRPSKKVAEKFGVERNGEIKVDPVREESEHELVNLIIDPEITQMPYEHHSDCCAPQPKPFTILQSKCPACLNKYKHHVKPKIPTLHRKSTKLEHVGSLNRSPSLVASGIMVFNMDVSHFKTNTLNNLICNAIDNSSKKSTIVCNIKKRVSMSLGLDRSTNDSGQGLSLPTLGSRIAIVPEKSTAVFNEASIKYLGEEIERREIKQRLKNFLNSN